MGKSALSSEEGETEVPEVPTQRKWPQQGRADRTAVGLTGSGDTVASL